MAVTLFDKPSILIRPHHGPMIELGATLIGAGQGSIDQSIIVIVLMVVVSVIC